MDAWKDGPDTSTRDQSPKEPATDTRSDSRSGDQPQHRHAMLRGAKPGDRHVRVIRSDELPLREEDRNYFVARPTTPPTRVGRTIRQARRILVGRPLATSQAIHERLTKTKALAVFSSDAISSTAYATEEILIVLVLIGTAAYSYVIPIGLAITALLAIVAFSYRQTIFSYPSGGGSYSVTKDNLGTLPSLVAAAALLIDYVLTVAVSIASGVAQITSAAGGLRAYSVEIALVAIVLITLANLRGVRESGTIFAIPTYLFIFGMIVLLTLGFAAAWLHIGVTPHHVTGAMPAATHSLTLFLLLRAFSSGCAALTGVEAISNGVPAFKAPEPRNAAQTLIWMALILGSVFMGITLLAHHFQLVPSGDETIISQLTHTIVGNSPFYYYVQFTTAGILLLAANTSFADFPRLASILARDKFLPHRFWARGDRLAFSTGIVALGVAAAVLIVAFGASVNALIPLYAVGVFTAFTLSQSSMTLRWWRSPRGRQRTTGMLINGTGAVATGVVAIIIVVTKFIGGAWIVLLLIPIIIWQLLKIRRHYDRVADQLRVSPTDPRAQAASIAHDHTAVVIPVVGFNRATLHAVRYASAISRDVTCVHVTDEPEAADQLRRDWDAARMRPPLVIIESPYRELVGPLVAYIEQLQSERDGVITVVLPEFVPAHLYELPLHNQTAWQLRLALGTHPGVAITSLRLHLTD